MKYEFKDGKLKVSLENELDMNKCKSLKSVIDGYIMRYEPEVLELDLSKVQFMDSSGIGLIVGRYNLIKLLNASMVVSNPSSSIKRIIEVSNLSKDIILRWD